MLQEGVMRGNKSDYNAPLVIARNSSGKGRRPVRALVLTPPRELAAQVADSVVTYGRYLPLRSTSQPSAQSGQAGNSAPQLHLKVSVSD